MKQVAATALVWSSVLASVFAATNDPATTEAKSGVFQWFAEKPSRYGYIAGAVLVILLALFPLVRRRIRWSRFHKEYLAEKAERERARKDADEEYRATGGGPARTYAAQGRQLPQHGNPDDQAS